MPSSCPTRCVCIVCAFVLLAQLSPVPMVCSGERRGYVAVSDSLYCPLSLACVPLSLVASSRLSAEVDEISRERAALLTAKDALADELKVTRNALAEFQNRHVQFVTLLQVPRFARLNDGRGGVVFCTFSYTRTHTHGHTSTRAHAPLSRVVTPVSTMCGSVKSLLLNLLVRLSPSRVHVTDAISS